MSGNVTQSSYPPSLFDAYTIVFEGNSVACILYGIYVVIVGANLSLLGRKHYNILLSYTIVQLVITTLYFAMSLYVAPAQSLAIFNIIGSYGPDALSPWPIVIVGTAFVLNTWASDGFLLYRCYVVCINNPCVVVVPAFLYLVTFGTSLAYLIVCFMPGAVYSNHAMQVTGICYWSCSAVMNICASCLISIRFWLHRRAIIRAIGYRQGEFYLEYMAMTLESALLYTVFVIIALVVFVLNSPLENLFFPILGTVQAIAPALTIYRIARGISLETDERGTSTGVTDSLRFSMSARTRPVRRSDFFDGSGTVHASTGVDIKVEQDSSDSFIQRVKEDEEA